MQDHEHKAEILITSVTPRSKLKVRAVQLKLLLNFILNHKLPTLDFELSNSKISQETNAICLLPIATLGMMSHD